MKKEEQITVSDLFVALAMHALIAKDPFPEPARVIAQALEYAQEFINQRGGK